MDHNCLKLEYHVRNYLIGLFKIVWAAKKFFQVFAISLLTLFSVTRPIQYRDEESLHLCTAVS